MSKASLQDQLLKAGLAKKGGKQPKQKKSAWGRVSRHDKDANTKPPAEIEAAKKAAAEKLERERRQAREAGARQREAEQRRAQRAEIRQLILDHAEKLPSHGEPFHFADQFRVLSLPVNARLRRGLATRKLRLATWDKRYYIVSAQTAEKIAQRDPAFLVALPSGGEIRDEAYAEHQVPDDLVW
ncbi:DUF2058 domain-containing protein [Guyparkeria hydrothermalis]|uniref:DUF2058 family protein n=1 Tax=Guyparkeria hydrothermalis TaxID=923 RepID=UPI002020BED2|nr:DUF2058 family protein [Guyparkeria hydrothermalis]MCL7751626.1 DUF2058 domain-containing protein [Guyparkeria hydrothermalis]